jgi:threonylcarbamoyladenosine tRNA methylthiotransferase MtaB
MGRTYDQSLFADLVNKVRKKLPSSAICLDVITGFPGETEQEFENTFEFISGLPVTDLHVFPYSKRPGTPAAALAGQVPGNVSRERAARLRQLAASKHRLFADSFVGKELEVVVEAGMKTGLQKGVSRNYLDIRFAGDISLAGKCVTVRPIAWQDDALRAELVS